MPPLPPSSDRRSAAEPFSSLPRYRKSNSATLGVLAAVSAAIAVTFSFGGGTAAGSSSPNGLAVSTSSHALAVSASPHAEEGQGGRYGGGLDSETFINPTRLDIEGGPLSNLRDLGPPGWVHPGSGRDVPVFWVVPKAGTSTIKSIMSKCLDLRMASSTSQVKFQDRPEKLEVVTVPSGKFLNVDFATPPGIRMGKELGLAVSGLADAMASSYIQDVAAVFETPPVPEGVLDTAPRGKMFATFRHPVERMVSDFFYMQGATWEKRTYDPENYKELEDYASDRTKNVDNWMVRLLSGNTFGPHCHHGGCAVTVEDYEFARTVIKRKCVVLMMDKMEESVHRLIHYGNWTERVKSPVCVQDFVSKRPSNRNNHQYVQSGTELFKKFQEVNQYDIMLYWWAQNVFDEQAARFPPFTPSPPSETEQKPLQHQEPA